MVLVCTRRFRFLNFTIFFYLFYFHFIFSLLFFTHDIYPHPHPRPTTHDPRHLATIMKKAIKHFLRILRFSFHKYFTTFFHFFYLFPFFQLLYFIISSILFLPTTFSYTHNSNDQRRFFLARWNVITVGKRRGKEQF